MGFQTPGGRKTKKVLVYSGLLRKGSNAGDDRYILYVDVKAKLPDVYTKLTKDNFFIIPSSISLLINSSPYSLQWDCTMSYDASSGRLTLSRFSNQDSNGYGGAWALLMYGSIYCIY